MIREAWMNNNLFNAQEFVYILKRTKYLLFVERHNHYYLNSDVLELTMFNWFDSKTCQKHPVVDPGVGGKGPMPPWPVKKCHRKDGRQAQLLIFHVSLSRPCPRFLDPLLASDTITQLNWQGRETVKSPFKVNTTEDRQWSLNVLDGSHLLLVFCLGRVKDGLSLKNVAIYCSNVAL